MARFFSLSGFNKISSLKKFKALLRWAAIFFVIAIIAAIFGFTGIAAGAASVAKIIFFVFIVLFAAGLVLGMSVLKKK